PQNSQFRLYVRDKESIQEHQEDGLSASDVVCKFQHDRVQQAAYALIDEDKKKEVHLRIGRLMLKSLSEEEKQEKIIEITRQFNEGRTLIEENDEKEKLARMNLQSAKKAKESTAYKPALEYLKKGKELLPEESWKICYRFTFDIFREYAECSYLCGNFEEAEKYINELLSYSKTAYEKAGILQMKALQYSTAGRLEESIEVGIAGLAELGVRVSPQPNLLAVLMEALLVKWRMRGRIISDLVHEPQMSDPNIKLQMKILMDLSAPAYFLGNDNLLVISVIKQVNLSLRYGNSPESAASYTGYGFILTAVLGDLTRGYEYGKLGIAVNEQLQDLEYKCRTISCHYFFIHHFHNHRKTLTDGFKEAMKAGYQGGDLLYMAYSCHHAPIWNPDNSLLEELENYKKYLPMIEETNYRDAWAYTMIAVQMRKNLCGQSNDRFSLSNKELDIDTFLKRMKETKFYTGLGVYYLCKGELHFTFNDYEEAANCFSAIDNSKKILNGIAGMPYQVEFFFFSALTLAASIKNRRNQSKEWKSLLKKYKQMKVWTNYCPENCLHLQLLIEAEMARISGNVSEAMSLYNQAITTAQENEFLRDEAIANEFTALFFIEQKSEKAAKSYFNDALYCYNRWGAYEKTAQLKEKYPAFFSEQATHSTTMNLNTTFTSSSFSSTLGTGTGGTLDLATVMKSSQTISSEIRLENLLKSMVSIMAQNAGAQKGVLILKDGEKFVIECHVDFDREEPIVLESIALELEATENGYPLPLSMINYVNRTSENLLVDNAMRDERFNSDPYILRVRPKSILAIPILHQAKLVGILYLENNLATAAFTPERVEMLQLLSAQAVTSLENARLYANMEHRVEERTEELKTALDDLHESQKKLIQSEKMASLGQLVAGVAHEINTPIGIGITSASYFDDITSKIIADFENDSIKKSSLVEYFKNAQSSAKLILNNLIRTGELIKSFKLVSADQTIQKRRKFDLKLYLEDIMKSLMPELKSPHIEVDISCPENIEMDTYAGSLVQVITNLTMNSKIHGFKERKNGKIDIEVIKAKNDRVTITFSDNGWGIEAKTLPKIFDPFFTTNRSGGGTGLGLHITFNIVTQTLQGEIRCESKPEEGATFIITIPQKTT
ncbi:MAG: GAF domain-containing protein, partial [Nitrospinae bacterium]|nr:GAF domain-containing protein [Nitrospinota bacterium]